MSDSIPPTLRDPNARPPKCGQVFGTCDGCEHENCDGCETAAQDPTGDFGTDEPDEGWTDLEENWEGDRE
jgi:hypothetical protein